jgi:hypothetical protein
MNTNEEIPEQNPPQPPKKSTRRNCASRQLSFFLRGGFGTRNSDEKNFDLFDDPDQGYYHHPYGAGAR